MSQDPLPNHQIPKLSVSVVTYNSVHLLDDLFESLSVQNGLCWELFVVDNASTDETAKNLPQYMCGHLTVNSCNVGFGRAHNQNRPFFRGRYILFLNPDVIFKAGLFAALVDFLETHAEVGAVGPRVLEGSGTAFPPRRFYPGERVVALEPGLRRNYYAWLPGCCLMMPRALFENLGGFDPDFFLYQEETDLCFRVRRAGYEIDWLPEWEVHHAHFQSQLRLSEYDRERRLVEATILFWEKHFSPVDLANIVRFQYWRARASQAVNNSFRSLKTPFSSEHLRARLDIYKEWLARRRCSAIGLNISAARIAVRQVRLIIEWIRRGKFPVDDY